MAKPLNFNNVRKRYLTVTLADENNTTLMIGTPTKAVMDDLILLKSSLEAIEEDGTDTAATDDLFAACAKVMSRNKAGIKISKADLEEIFDFEDIMIFFSAYMDFVSEVTSGKN